MAALNIIMSSSITFASQQPVRQFPRMMQRALLGSFGTNWSTIVLPKGRRASFRRDSTLLRE